MIRTLFFAGLAAGVVAVITPAAAAPQVQRLVWSYQGGAFKYEENGNWVEENGDGKFKFKEVTRTEDYIEMRDASRDCTVRLYNTAMWMKGNYGRYPDFTKYYNGKWTK